MWEWLDWQRVFPLSTVRNVWIWGRVDRTCCPAICWVGLKKELKGRNQGWCLGFWLEQSEEWVRLQLWWGRLYLEQSFEENVSSSVWDTVSVRHSNEDVKCATGNTDLSSGVRLGWVTGYWIFLSNNNICLSMYWIFLLYACLDFYCICRTTWLLKTASTPMPVGGHVCNGEQIVSYSGPKSNGSSV